jgi:hypothetical protein
VNWRQWTPATGWEISFLTREQARELLGRINLDSHTLTDDLMHALRVRAGYISH